MSIETDEDELLNGSPDPSWDYYVLWHSLNHVKAKINAALRIMADNEDSDPNLDKQIKDLLEPASDVFIQIIDVALNVEDEDE
ncbi:MAG: hypothetical protein V7K94_20560 [Nostoc sp.]|uniref:hypothetical protein n=1 Tax=Nostoc sp. TaxID=1180 RepID=UPI002FF9208D